MKLIKSRLSILITYTCYIVLFFLTSTYSQAQVFTGPVSSSTGGAGIAATETSETILLNPATIVHAKDFTFGAYYMDGYWTERLHERTFGGTLIDNHEDTLIPGGLSYFQRKRHFFGIGSIEEMFVQATLGQFIGKYFAFGIALTYLDQDYGSGHKQWNGQLGAMYTPHDRLGIGVVIQNFIKPENSVPVFLRESLKLGLGATYLFDKYFKVKADAVTFKKDDRGWRGKYMLGVESDISEYLAVRMGYNISDVSHLNYYTFGLGLKTPRFGIDYSIQLKEGDRRGAMHSVDLRAPL